MEVLRMFFWMRSVVRGETGRQMTTWKAART
jgi:hypothetical protein